MEADVRFSTQPESLAHFDHQPQVVFRGDQHILEQDDVSVDVDGASDVTSIPPIRSPVLKNTAKSVLRSKDYADQLENIIAHIQSSDANGSKADLENNPAHAVLQEMAAIMKKLENDRAKIRHDLEHEREQVVRLQNRLDSFVEKRLKELPFAVQREHEACAVDIVELQWHVAFKRRQETRINAKLQLAENLNEKLRSELSYVQDTDPKLSQKLQLENKVIVNLLQAHNVTATELMKTLKEQEQSELESEKAESKAEKERNYLKKEIDGVKKTLQKAQNDLRDAEKLHARYIHNIEETKTMITDTEEATEEQIEKLEKVKELEKMQEEKVKDLEEKLHEAEKHNFQLKDERDKSLKSSEENQTRRDQEKVTLEAYVSNNERRFRQLQTENRNMKFENQDLENQIQDNEAQKQKDDKIMERLYKDIEKNEAECSKIKDLYFNLDLDNKTLNKKLADIDEKSREREEFLDQQIESLNAQVRDEVAKRGQLQGNINTEKNNLVNLELDLKKQEERMEKKAQDVDAAVTKVKGQVEKMREKNEVRKKQLQELLNALEKLKGIHKETETKLRDKKSNLKPKLEGLKAEDLELSRQLDQMDYMSEKLTGELREMKLGAIHLNRVIRNTKNSIEDLTTELEETKIRCSEKKRAIADLEQSLGDLTDRLKQNRDSFKALIKDRKSFHHRMQQELENRVKENEKLAEDYYSLKQQLFALKTDYNSVFQQQVELEQTVRNLRQVEFLQQAFNRKLREYFKYRNLFYSAELEDLKVAHDMNEDKIQGIKVEMEAALNVMSKFLTSIMQGSLFKDLKEEELKAIDDESLQPEVQQDVPEIVVTQSEATTSQSLSQFKILPPISNLRRENETESASAAVQVC